MNRKIFFACCGVWLIIGGVFALQKTEAQKFDKQAILSKIRNTPAVEVKDIDIDQANPDQPMIKLKIGNKVDQANLRFIVVGNEEQYATFHFGKRDQVEPGMEKTLELGSFQLDDLKQGKLQIMASGYTDRTYQGDPRYYKQIIQKYDTQSDEMSQILHLIDEVSSLKDEDAMTAFKERFRSLPPLENTGDAPNSYRQFARSVIEKTLNQYDGLRAQGVRIVTREWLNMLRNNCNDFIQ